MNLKGPRKFHEASAADTLRRALHATERGTQPCDVKRFVAASRLVAQARVHINSIGPKDSRRTRKLWGVVGRLEKRLNSIERGCGW